MTPELASSISIFVLALLVGFEVISKIPTTLHTPMMSGANSIHGVVLVGAILVAGLADDALGYVLAFLASAFAAMNVVGGYVVTDRMLGMFRGNAPRTSPSANATSPSANGASPSASRAHEAAGGADGAKGVAGLAGAERGTSEADGSPSAVGPSRRLPDHLTDHVTDDGDDR